jgi:drug/metabolite transporter (DMT)-like permease
MNVRDVFEWLLLGGLWGASFLFMRVASPEFGPIALIAMRVSAAALFLIIPMMLSRNTTMILRFWKQLLVLGALNSAIPFTLFAYATLSMKAGDAAVLNATAPLFGGLIGYVWFRELLSMQKIIGLLIGFCGVVILVWGKLGGADGVMPLLAGLAAAVLYGVGAHYSKHALKGVPPLVVSNGSLIAAAIMLLPLALLTWPVAMPSGTSWLCVAALGLGCTAIAYLLYFRLLRNVGAANAMTVAYLIPVFGILWGYLFLQESVTISTWIGGLTVLAGTSLVNAPQGRSPALVDQEHSFTVSKASEM